MKKEDLIEAIGQADERYILEAVPKPVVRNLFRTVLPVAASVLVLLAAGLFMKNFLLGGKKSGSGNFISNNEIGAFSNDELYVYEEAAEETLACDDAFSEDYANDCFANEDSAVNDYEIMTGEMEKGIDENADDLTSEELLRRFIEDAEAQLLFEDFDLLSEDERKETLENMIFEDPFLQALSEREDRLETVNTLLAGISGEDTADSLKQQFLRYLSEDWTP